MLELLKRRWYIVSIPFMWLAGWFLAELIKSLGS
jgi:hypothetical protein